MIDFIAYWLVRSIGFILIVLPIEAALAFARGLGSLLALTQIRADQAYANIKSAFPGRFSGPEIRSIIRSNYRSMCQNLVEMFWFPKMTREFAEKHVVIPRVDRYFECKKAGKGTALLTAHFGNWEYLNIRTCFLGIPIFVIVRDQKRPRLNAFLTGLRESHGSKMVRKEGAELREVIKALKNNEMVGFLGDQQGGKSGVPVRFFGRITTSPAGPIQIPMRTGSKVLPVFIVREHGPHHTVHVEEEIALVNTGNEESDLRVNMQTYINKLEEFVTKYPHQWHWLHKRWKHNWTKRVVILSDGKAGHVVQSKAVYKLLEKFKDTDSRYEFQSRVIEIRYKNEFARRAFPVFAFLMMPFIQGRLHWLKAWLTPESYAAFEPAAADIVISCGASLLPLNYILKRECLAKNVVIMKPYFPFSLFRPDIAFVPEHDTMKESERVVFTRVALSLIDPEELKIEGKALRRELNLDHQKVVSVFLGGKTKNYDFETRHFDKFIKEMSYVMDRNSFELLVTTSRRTRSEFEDKLKKKYGENKRVPLLVIANESNPAGIVPKMMGASEVLVISEDSVSMISEAVVSGKSVIVLRLAKNGLARKHYRFQERLAAQGILRIATPDNISEVLEDELNHRKTRMVLDDSQRIQGRLKTLL